MSASNSPKSLAPFLKVSTGSHCKDALWVEGDQGSSASPLHYIAFIHLLTFQGLKKEHVGAHSSTNISRLYFGNIFSIFCTHVNSVVRNDTRKRGAHLFTHLPDHNINNLDFSDFIVATSSPPVHSLQLLMSREARSKDGIQTAVMYMLYCESSSSFKALNGIFGFCRHLWRYFSFHDMNTDAPSAFVIAHRHLQKRPVLTSGLGLGLDATMFVFRLVCEDILVVE